MVRPKRIRSDHVLAIPALSSRLAAQLQTRESFDDNVLAQSPDRLRQDLLNSLVIVLHEGLIQETVLGVELLNLALDDLLPDVLWLILHLTQVDLALFIDDARI